MNLFMTDYSSFSISREGPDKPHVEIEFEKGIPVKVNGEKCPIDLMKTLNKVGGENGIGIIDIVENRLVG